jgi:hypothetical protein
MLITKFMARSNGSSLRGYVDAKYGSLIIQGIAIHQRDGRAWLQLPNKPRVDYRTKTLQLSGDGKVQYDPVVDWASADAAKKFKDSLLAELTEQHPDALTRG